MVEYGGLSIAVIRDLIAQVNNPELEAFDLLGATPTVTQAKDPRPGRPKDGAERRLHDLLASGAGGSGPATPPPSCWPRGD